MFTYAKPDQKQSDKTTVQKKESEKAASTPNQTGIPDPMKTHFESLSGFSFDDVRVHYNSGKPAQLQALAYTQGNQVYVAPGQERHLGHELGHVVQQKEGRVKPTTRINGRYANDNIALEKDADLIQNSSAFYAPQEAVGNNIIQKASTPKERKVDAIEKFSLIIHSAILKDYAFIKGADRATTSSAGPPQDERMSDLNEMNAVIEKYYKMVIHDIKQTLTEGTRVKIGDLDPHIMDEIKSTIFLKVSRAWLPCEEGDYSSETLGFMNMYGVLPILKNGWQAKSGFMQKDGENVFRAAERLVGRLGGKTGLDFSGSGIVYHATEHIRTATPPPNSTIFVEQVGERFFLIATGHHIGTKSNTYAIDWCLSKVGSFATTQVTL